MLKGISPLLSSDLLRTLNDMGHGDEIAVVDANFTAQSLSRRVLSLPGAPMRTVCSAILSVFPLDDFVERPAAFMQVGGTEAGYRSELQREVIGDLELHHLGDPFFVRTASVPPHQRPQRLALWRLEVVAHWAVPSSGLTQLRLLLRRPSEPQGLFSLIVALLSA